MQTKTIAMLLLIAIATVGAIGLVSVAAIPSKANAFPLEIPEHILEHILEDSGHPHPNMTAIIKGITPQMIKQAAEAAENATKAANATNH